MKQKDALVSGTLYWGWQCSLI